MPRILANQHTHSTPARIEGAKGFPRRKKAAIIEEAIGRQVHFAMQMQQASLREIGGSDVIVPARVLLDKTDDNIQMLTGVEQGRHSRILGRGARGNRGHQVFEVIAREREFGKHDEMRLVTLGAGEIGEDRLEVGIHIPQTWGELSECKFEFHHSSLYRKMKQLPICQIANSEYNGFVV